MATTFSWKELNGASGSQSENTATNMNLGNNDSVNLVPATYPIAANANSYAKYIMGYWEGDFTQISNVKFWKSAGAYVTGETISMSGAVLYATPDTADHSSDGIISPTQPDGANVPIPGDLHRGDDAWIGYDISGSIAGDGISTTGSTMPIRLQLQTTASTPAGAVNQKTFTMTYDRQ